MISKSSSFLLGLLLFSVQILVVYSSSETCHATRNSRVCPLGHFCEVGSGAPRECLPGSYADETGLSSCKSSPAGYYADDSGMDAPLPCAIGTYSDIRYSECLPCEWGHTCTVPALSKSRMLSEFVCPPGTYCPAGTSTDPLPCPVGFQCPRAGMGKPHPCPAGTHTNTTSTILCAPVTAGQYALQGAVDATGFCAEGHYCPTGSSSASEVPCPAGTYNPVIAADSDLYCLECVAGFYCPPASSTPVVCPQGSYCPPGSATPIPCPVGTFGNASSLTEEALCARCTPGQYCDQPGLQYPSGPCDPGYYCSGGAPTSSPGSNPTLEADWLARLGFYGALCSGGFCPGGSQAPQPCPAGTFMNSTGESSPTACLVCSAGSYCAETASEGPTGPCDPGYYCTGGAISPQQHITPNGTYTRSGASAPVLCPVGTLGREPGLNECEPCPAGWFCDKLGLDRAEVCPKGHYCPEGAAQPTQCPAGTFNRQEGAESASQCLPCPEGYYCSTSGLEEPSGTCDRGFYCTGGSYLKDPTAPLVTFGDVCPRGHYCPAGSFAPVACPAGTFSPSIAAWEPSACTPCSPGRYCGRPGLESPSGPCEAGFFCRFGVAEPRPGLLHLATNNAPLNLTDLNSTGVDLNTLDWDEFYGEFLDFLEENDLTHRLPEFEPATFNDVCFAIESLEYNTTRTHTGFGGICPPGYACPEGSVYPQRCLEGFYAPRGSPACLSCPPGAICPSAGLDQPESCPSGSYCIGGSAVPTGLCPQGSFGSSGLAAANQCTLCPGGLFCGSSGLEEPSGSCEAGYFCPPGSSSSRGLNIPSFNASNGFQGPFYAELPDADPEEAYIFLETHRKSEILLFTPLAALRENPCPPGFFCPANSTLPTACAAGSHQPSSAAKHPLDCVLCPSGSFCGAGGLALPAGNCSAGHFCARGCTTSTPLDGPLLATVPAWVIDPVEGDRIEGSVSMLVGGDSCPPGHYCPAASAEPLACPGGTFMNESGSPGPCLACPTGYYCPTGTADPTPNVCPAGHFCPLGTKSALQFPCPSGSFRAIEGGTGLGSCSPCPPGLFCGTAGLDTPSGQCDAGYFCTYGSASSRPPHTNTNASYALVAVTEGNPSGIVAFGALAGPCGPGDVCPTGSAARSPCPPGHYCDGTAESFELTSGGITGICAAGFFCVQGSWLARPAGQLSAVHAMAAGALVDLQTNNLNYLKLYQSHYSPYFSPLFNLTHSSNSSCPQLSVPSGGLPSLGLAAFLLQYARPSNETAGHLHNRLLLASSSSLFWLPPDDGSGTGSPQSVLEAPLDYALAVASVAAAVTGSIGDICPPGFFCPAGAAAPVACPTGTFMPVPGADALPRCRRCPSGRFCPSVGLSNETQLPLCPAGRFCPAGTAFPSSLPLEVNETLAAQQQLALFGADADVYDDVDELHGMYALGLFQNVSAECPHFHRCPLGSAEPIPCPSGSFGGLSGGAACPACDAGLYCPVPATSLPLDCPYGHFCPTGTSVPSPCAVGSFGPDLGLRAQEDCSTCPQGAACPETGLSSPLACSAGHFCRGNTTTTHPIVVTSLLRILKVSSVPASYAGEYGSIVPPVQGDICPPGHFCAVNSSAPSPCPAGTFFNASGASDSSECISCLPGWICPQAGLPTPTALCPAGYFCPGGSVTGLENPAPLGHFAPGGTASASECAPGTHANSTGRTACSVCPQGYLCDEQAMIDPKSCPFGHFCPLGSALPTGCPAGSFRNETHGGSVLACMNCPAGRYCGSTGLANPSGNCRAGLLCRISAVSADSADSAGPVIPQTPVNPLVIRSELCPRGHYCDSGVPAPVQCPPGRFRSQLGAESLEACTLCTAGQFCGSWGLLQPSGPCSPGYYCPEGTNSSHPPSSICPLGHFCVGGLSEPTPCAAGTFASTEGLSVCSACPAGHFCELGAREPLLCPVGHRCSGSTGVPTVCQDGTYASTVGRSVCDSCPAGKFCAAGPSGRNHASTTLPEWLWFTHNIPLVCDADRSYYDPQEDKVFAIDPESGIYVGHELDPEAANHTTLISLVGHLRYVQNMVGRDELGPFVSSLVDPLPCPLGHYCPGSVGPVSPAPLACPAGLIGNLTGLEAPEECFACPAGSYCVGGFVAGPCAPGYVCYHSNGRPDPDFESNGVPATIGRPCPRGFYCPEGSFEPISCPDSLFGTKTHAVSEDDGCGPCPMGFICIAGNPVPIECPTGHYCPAGAPIECPPGTYNPYLAEWSIDSCLVCPAGSLCLQSGVGTLDAVLCPTGHFCPLPGATNTSVSSLVPCPPGTHRPTPGAAGVTDCALCPGGRVCPFNATVAAEECPAGSVCPPGTIEPAPCPAGYYCPEGSETPRPCPAAYYCPEASAWPQLCPEGFHCPSGAQYPLLCPRGTARAVDSYAPVDFFDPLDFEAPFSNGTNSSRGERVHACIVCPRGTYADTAGSGTCFPCQPGYVCLGGTTSAGPLEIYLERGYICPVGHYCPEGSFAPIACAPGTYNPLEGQSSPSACQLCPPNYFQDLPGQHQCRLCAGSSVAPPGAHACTCTGANRAYHPSDGLCICLAGYEFYDASFNRLSEIDGPEDCQPIVLDACRSGEVRAPGGGCVRSAAAAVDRSQLCDRQCEGVKASFPGINESHILTYLAQPSILAAGITWADLHDSEGHFIGFPGSRGTFNPRLGVCECLGIPPLEQVCGRDCVSRSPKMYVGPDGTASVQFLVDPQARSAAEARLLHSSNYFDPLDGNRNRRRLSVPAAVAAIESAALSFDFNNLNGFMGSVCCYPGLKRGLPLELADDLSIDIDLNIDLFGSEDDVTESDPDSLDVIDDENGCRLVGIGVRGRAFYGQFGVPSVIQRALGIHVDSFNASLPTSLATYPSFVSNLTNGSISPLLGVMYGTSQNDLHTSPQVSAPAVCLRLGDGLLFDLVPTSPLNLSSLPPGVVDTVTYPIYMKDSLLNTNGNFDYGAFRRLREAIRGGASVTSFGFTFMEPGMYVLGSSTSPDLLMVVSVMSAGAACPTALESPLEPAAAAVLSRLGVRHSNALFVAVNWVTVGGVLGALMGVLLLAIIVGTVLQARSWTGGRAGVPIYKQKASMLDVVGWHEKGATTTSKTLSIESTPPPSASTELSLTVGAEEAEAQPRRLSLLGLLGKNKVAPMPFSSARDSPVHQMDRWDRTDLDMAALAERLDSLSDRLQASFETLAAVSEGVRLQLQTEAAGLTRAVAFAGLELQAAHATTVAVSGDSPSTALLRERDAAVSRAKDECERGYSGDFGVQSRLSKIQSALQELHGFLTTAGGPEQLATKCVDNVASDVDNNMTNKTVPVSSLKSAEIPREISRLCLAVLTSIEEAVQFTQQERNRRSTQPLGRALSALARFDLPRGTLVAAVSSLEGVEAAIDAHVRYRLCLSAAFAANVPMILRNIHVALSNTSSKLNAIQPGPEDEPKKDWEGIDDEDEMGGAAMLRARAVSRGVAHVRNGLQELSRLTGGVLSSLSALPEAPDRSEADSRVRALLASVQAAPLSSENIVEKSEDAGSDLDQRLQALVADIMDHLNAAAARPSRINDIPSAPSTTSLSVLPSMQSKQAEDISIFTGLSDADADLEVSKAAAALAAAAAERKALELEAERERSLREETERRLQEERSRAQRLTDELEQRLREQQQAALAQAQQQALTQLQSIQQSIAPSFSSDPEREDDVEDSTDTSDRPELSQEAVAAMVETDLKAELAAMQELLAQQRNQQEQKLREVLEAEAAERAAAATRAAAALAAAQAEAQTQSALAELRAQQLQELSEARNSADSEKALADAEARKILQDEAAAEQARIAGAVEALGAVQLGEEEKESLSILKAQEQAESLLSSHVDDHAARIAALRAEFEAEAAARARAQMLERARQADALQRSMAERRMRRMRAVTHDHSGPLSVESLEALESELQELDSADLLKLQKEQEAADARARAAAAAADQRLQRELDAAAEEERQSRQLLRQQLENAFEKRREDRNALCANATDQAGVNELAQRAEAEEKRLLQLLESTAAAAASGRASSEALAARVRAEFNEQQERARAAVLLQRQEQAERVRQRLAEREKARLLRMSAAAPGTSVVETEEEPLEQLLNAIPNLVEAVESAIPGSDVAEVSLEDALRRLHEQHEEEAAALLAKVQSSGRAQAASSAARLRARARAREDALRARQLQEAQALRKQQLSSISSPSSMDTTVPESSTGPVSSSEDVLKLEAAVEQAEKEALEQAQRATAERLEELRKQHAAERAAAEAAMQQDLEQLLRQDEAAAKERQQQLEQQLLDRIKQERAQANVGDSTSAEEEARRVREEFELALGRARAQEDKERSKQRARMQSQLELRRQRQRAVDERRHAEEEMRIKSEAQFQAREAAAAAATSALLGSTSTPQNVSEMDKLNALKARHAKESLALLDAQFEERTTALQHAMKTAFEDQRLEKVRLAAAGIPDMHTEDELREARELRVRTCAEQLERTHERQTVSLKRRQMQEIAQVLNFSIDSTSSSSSNAEADLMRKFKEEEASRASAAAAELSALEAQLRKQQQDQEQAREAAREAREKELAAAAAQMQQEHERLLAEEKRAAEAELKQRRQQLLLQAEQAQRERLAATEELDQEARQRLISNFEAEKVRIDERIGRVRSQQQGRIEEQLEQRRLRRQLELDKKEQLRRAEEERKQRLEKEEKRRHAFSETIGEPSLVNPQLSVNDIVASITAGKSSNEINVNPNALKNVEKEKEKQRLLELASRIADSDYSNASKSTVYVEKVVHLPADPQEVDARARQLAQRMLEARTKELVEQRAAALAAEKLNAYKAELQKERLELQKEKTALLAAADAHRANLEAAQREAQERLALQQQELEEGVVQRLSSLQLATIPPVSGGSTTSSGAGLSTAVVDELLTRLERVEALVSPGISFHSLQSNSDAGSVVHISPNALALREGPLTTLALPQLTHRQLLRLEFTRKLSANFMHDDGVTVAVFLAHSVPVMGTNRHRDGVIVLGAAEARKAIGENCVIAVHSFAGGKPLNPFSVSTNGSFTLGSPNSSSSHSSSLGGLGSPRVLRSPSSRRILDSSASLVAPLSSPSQIVKQHSSRNLTRSSSSKHLNSTITSGSNNQNTTMVQAAPEVIQRMQNSVQDINFFVSEAVIDNSGTLAMTFVKICALVSCQLALHRGSISSVTFNLHNDAVEASAAYEKANFKNIGLLSTGTTASVKAVADSSASTTSTPQNLSSSLKGGAGLGKHDTPSFRGLSRGFSLRSLSKDVPGLFSNTHVSEYHQLPRVDEE